MLPFIKTSNHYQNEALQAEASLLRKHNYHLETETKWLREELDAAKIYRDYLGSLNNGLTQQISDLVEKLDGSDDEYENLRVEFNDLVDDFNDLIDDFNGLANDYNKVEAERVTLNYENKQLRATLFKQAVQGAKK